MSPRRVCAAVATALAVLAAGTYPAAAVPPVKFGPFPVGEDLLSEVKTSIEDNCGVEVTDITGDGTIRFVQFLNADGDAERGQGWFNFTIDVTTSTGATATIRERSMDKYSGPELATVDSTSGRATALLGAIGRIDADGNRVGRTYDICASLT